MSQTTQQVNNFASMNNIKLNVIGEPQYKKHFTDDKSERWVFKMKLTRNGKSYTFNFGQSIASGCTPPKMYDVLACIEKYGYSSFEDFCNEMGYDTDSRNAEKTYKAVQKEFAAVERLFSDIMEELRDIQ